MVWGLVEHFFNMPLNEHGNFPLKQTITEIANSEKKMRKEPLIVDNIIAIQVNLDMTDHCMTDFCI